MQDIFPRVRPKDETYCTQGCGQLAKTYIDKDRKLIAHKCDLFGANLTFNQEGTKRCPKCRKLDTE